MRLQFKNQQFQSDASKAVTDVFEGQRNQEMQDYTLDFGIAENSPHDMYAQDYVGFRNSNITLSAEKVLENIRNIQITQMLRPSDSVDLDDLRLTIEMETGTGKTYTYIKTMFELNKLYGWSKFIVVVPSIAIREGVIKSFDIMSDHFAQEYGKRIQSFVYDSAQLTKIDQFASDSNMHVMIINTQAFNARGEDARRIYMKMDSFRSRKPIDVIASTRPILIIDEPQSVLGADKKNSTRQRLKEFNPLFTLLYSATHRVDDIVNMIYRLDAMDAYNQKLVKKITVKGIEQKGTTATNGYLYLESIELDTDKNPQARIGFDVKTATGTKQITKLVSDGFDIYQQSGGLEEYSDGYRIETIDGHSNTIRLLNGTILSEGDVIGDVNEEVIRRAQIRETIKSHLEKERKLYKLGIKCLSLFFIDHVDNYRLYGEGGKTSNGRYAEIFEEEYNDILGAFQLEFGDEPYVKYLKRFNVSDVHNGYFSRDKKGHYVQPKNSELKAESSNDVSAYDLIMKDKERLLSMEEPTRFIFSHSALKEGWDNPNVFQICTLKDSDNTTKKRQEVGRGMRLCVNNKGERQDENVLHGRVFEINELTVIASESYNSFANRLQTEIADAVGDRPKKVAKELFLNLVFTDADGVKTKVGEDDAQEIMFIMRLKNYTDKKGQLTSVYHKAVQEGTLDFGEYDEYKNDIIKALNTVFDSSVVKPENARGSREARFDSKKFERKEFQTLWQKINKQTYYTVDFDTDELIKNSVENINNHLIVSEIKLRVVTGTMDKIKSKTSLEQGHAMKVTDTQTKTVNEVVGTSVKYDLIGKLVEETQLTRKAVVEILTKIQPATFQQFHYNPEDFIIKCGNLINECKAIAVIEHIKYHKLNKEYDSDIFSGTTLKGKLGVNAMESEKSLYDLVVVDSVGTEMNFAKDLESESDVVVYTKLPNGFYINTPVGHYNPDWAIVFKEGTDIKHIYFVAETKGSLSETQLRATEKAKIDCARKHFNVIGDSTVSFGVVKDYSSLRDIITK